MKVYGQLERAQFENLAADPTGADLVEGRVWFRTDLDVFKGYANGIVVEFADLTTAQVFANKTYADPNITGPSTYNEVVGTPTTPAAGTVKVYLKDDGLLYKLDSEGNEIPVGSGSGGGLDVYHTEDFEINNAADYSTGNNASFLGGGALAGTLADETAAPMSKNRNLKYTQAAGSLNDYAASPVIDIDPKQAGNDSGLNLYFKYSGDKNDIAIVLYDDTNDVVISSDLDLLADADNPSRFGISALIPVGVTEIRWGFQVKVENIGAVLELDDVELSTNPFVYKNLIDRQSYRLNQGQDAMSDRLNEVRFNLGTAAIIDDGVPMLLAVDDAGNTRTQFVAQRSCYVDVSFSARTPASKNPFILLNGVGIKGGSETTSGSDYGTVSCAFFMAKGDYLSFAVGSKLTLDGSSVDNVTTPCTVFISAEADSENIVSASKSSETEEKILSSDILANGNVAGLQFTDLVIGDRYQLNGQLVYTLIGDVAIECFVENENSSNPIGRITSNHSGPNNSVRTKGFNFIFTAQSETVNFRLTSVDASSFLNGDGTKVESFAQLTNLTSHFLTAIPIQRPMFLKDLKSSGVAGGTFTAGSYITRELNDVSGEESVGSLSSNQITLGEGEYEVMAWTPAHDVDLHQCKLYNVTDAVDEAFGCSTKATATQNDVSESVLVHTLKLSSTKVFEIRHRANTTKAASGLGEPTGFGNTEVYTQVKITKLR